MKIAKSLNSDVAPASIAGGVLIGCLMGLMPLGPQTVILLVLLLVLRVNFSVGMVIFGLTKLIHLAVLHFVGAPLGAALLRPGSPARPLFAWMMNVRVLGLVPFENNATAGGFVLGLLLGLGLFYPVVRGVRSYRVHLRERVAASKTY